MGQTHAIAPGLHVVATPIGNARDMTFRAVDTLAAADLIACEDTRVTAKLLAMHGISAPTIAYHEHNAERVRPKILERLAQGETVALVSDAGTPLVSDPGYRLVGAAIRADIPVTTEPGASSILAALVLSGLPANRFVFEGFLPARSGPRRKALAEIATVPATLVILESPKRLASALADMAQVLGPREAAVARELTKKFEEVRRAPLPALAEHYATAGPPKGEVVVVIGPPVARTDVDGDDLDARIKAALENGSLRDAVGRVAAETGLARKLVYERALTLVQSPAGKP